MASRKTLFEVTYHNDDDTGIYFIGEVDFGISGEFDNYIKAFGSKGLDDVLLTLNHLIWHVNEYGGRIIKEINETEQNNNGKSTRRRI